MKANNFKPLEGKGCGSVVRDAAFYTLSAVALVKAAPVLLTATTLLSPFAPQIMYHKRRLIGRDP
jgi:hypothetical protein